MPPISQSASESCPYLLPTLSRRRHTGQDPKKNTTVMGMDHIIAVDGILIPRQRPKNLRHRRCRSTSFWGIAVKSFFLVHSAVF